MWSDKENLLPTTVRLLLRISRLCLLGLALSPVVMIVWMTIGRNMDAPWASHLLLLIWCFECSGGFILPLMVAFRDDLPIRFRRRAENVWIVNFLLVALNLFVGAMWWRLELRYLSP